LPIYGASLLACLLGASWHHEDLEHGESSNSLTPSSLRNLRER
jgi:hypothetical protein